MGLHDWRRVTDNVFHTFHYGWLWNLAGLLNAQVLPPGYVARPEEYVGPYEADVLTLHSGVPAPPSGGGGTALEPVLTLSPPRLRLGKERRIAIHSARDERRVAIIEVVSPGNKDSARRAAHLQSKLIDALESGLHVVVIDVLPPTGVCASFPGAVARALGATDEPRLGERHAASFEVQLDPLRLNLYGRDLTLGRPLPDDVPLFLLDGARVALPLERSYEATVAMLSAADRALL